MTAPRTEAGRRLLAAIGDGPNQRLASLDPLILAIEAEAATPDAADLRDAVELMDTKVTPYGERDDGTTSAYLVADSTWHRVLAIARGSMSDNARKAIDDHRRAATPDAADDLPDVLAACWFCRRMVSVDYLIAGYDTFEEQRLACDDCDRCLKALHERDHVLVPRTEYERLQRIEAAARGLDLRPDRAITDGNAIAALREALGDKPT